MQVERRVSSPTVEVHVFPTHQAGKNFNVGCEGSSEKSTVRAVIMTHPPRDNASHQDSMTGSQNAEIHHSTLNNGHEEPAEPGNTMLRDESVLGDGVVNGHKERNRVESEEEEYVSEFDEYGIRPDEARY